MSHSEQDPGFVHPPPGGGGPPGNWTLIAIGTTTVGPGATVVVLSLTRLTAAVPMTLNYVDTTMLGELVSNDWAAMDIPGGGAGVAGTRYRRSAGMIDERYEMIISNAWNDGAVSIAITMDWRHYEVQA